jgi:predicted molibdopterin-dependent oxidoreductase YjgC
MTAPAEADGTYTNLERRVQRLRQVLSPKGETKPAWRIFSEVGLRIRPETPLFNPSEVMGRIASEVPAFAGVSYDQLGGEGFLLGVGPDLEAEEPHIPPQTNG